MELRDYQKEAFDLARRSIARGLKRPIIAAPTAFGKTILAGAICKSAQEKGKIAWFICDRLTLLEQTIDKFSQMGIDFGVRQSDHELTDKEKTVQIVSIQTLMAEVKNRGNRLPEFDMAIVDECHTQYEILKEIVRQYNNIPVIGLTATPYSKGLGKLYNNLIVPITPKELLDRNYLCPVRYYVGSHINLGNVRSINANAFDPKDIERETDKDSDVLIGSIVKNWMEYGENSQTIAFCPTQNLSKSLVNHLVSHGITAEHIDCYHDTEERKDLFKAHRRGEFKVLSCSRLLNTGYDEPAVKCIIDCFPTKSVTVWCQRVGRLMRTFEDKEYTIYLDHADNYSRFGPAEDIVPVILDDGKKAHNERNSTNLKDKKIKTKKCPECYQEMVIPACSHCGYQMPQKEIMEDDDSMLEEAKVISLEEKRRNKTDSRDIKEQFYSEMIFYATQKGYKRGWAANQYRDRYGVWPNKIRPYDIEKITSLGKGWITHKAMKYKSSKGR